MGVMGERDQRFVGMERKVGLFFTAIAAGVVLLMTLIGMKHDLFARKETVSFMAVSGYGLSEGMPVKLSGFTVGKVNTLTLDDVAHVKVEMSVNNKYMKWIKSDSRARLNMAGFMGENFIEITPGSPSRQPLQSDELIAFEREKGVTELLEEVDKKIVAVLDDVTQTLNVINDPRGDVKLTLRNVNRLSMELLDTRKRVDMLLADTDKGLNKAVGHIDAVVGSADKTMASIDGFIANLNTTSSRLDRTLEHADSLVTGADKQLQPLLKTLNDVASDLRVTSTCLPGVLEKSSNTVDEASDVLGSVKRVWPVRNYVERPEQKPLKVDSNEPAH